MVGDLEEIEPRQAGGEQVRVDVLLDVARQQETACPDPTEQHDRHVVDARPAIRRFERDLAGDRPQDRHLDLVDIEPIAGGQSAPFWGTRAPKSIEPGGIPRAWSACPGFEDAADAIPIEQPRQPADMVLVRVRQDDGVEPAIPRRKMSVERDQQSVGVRSAVDEQATTARPFHEDGITLADIEDRDPSDAG